MNALFILVEVGDVRERDMVLKELASMIRNVGRRLKLDLTVCPPERVTRQLTECSILGTGCLLYGNTLSATSALSGALLNMRALGNVSMSQVPCISPIKYGHAV